MSTRDPLRDPPPSFPSCIVSTQALCFGEIETSVFAVARSAARPGERTHIGIKYGRVLIYLEDRAALESLANAVEQALEMAGAVYGPLRDAFTEVEARARQRFERTGDVTQLNG